MRRATNPAICVKPMRTPSLRSTRKCWRSFSSLALSRSAFRNFPAIYTTRLIVPRMGVRLMCTSNTLIKIDTLVIGWSPSPSGPRNSTGGCTFSIKVTSPSAGATTKRSSMGVARAGSRKNDNVQTVTAPMGHASVSQAIKAKNRVMQAAISPNLRPSG